MRSTVRQTKCAKQNSRNQFPCTAKGTYLYLKMCSCFIVSIVARSCAIYILIDTPNEHANFSYFFSFYVPPPHPPHTHTHTSNRGISKNFSFVSFSFTLSSIPSPEYQRRQLHVVCRANRMLLLWFWLRARGAQFGLFQRPHE